MTKMPQITKVAEQAIRPIRNEDDYEATLAEVEQLFGAEPGTPEGDRFEVLAILVEAYEQHHHRIGPPTAVGAIKHVMEARGMTNADLEPYIGAKGRVSEVLNGKRGLTINMIRKLMTLGIPAEVLLKAHDQASEEQEHRSESQTNDLMHRTIASTPLAAQQGLGQARFQTAATNGRTNYIGARPVVRKYASKAKTSAGKPDVRKARKPTSNSQVEGPKGRE